MKAALVYIYCTFRFFFQDHFPVITEAELKYILGNEHSVQIKSSVNKAGHSVVLAIVKGKDLGERLVKKVKTIMSFKTR